MKKFVASLICAASLIAASVSNATPLVVVADEWPPFSGASLPRNGLSLDVIQTTLERAGYEVDVRVIPWPRILDGAERGEFDVIGSLFQDEELAETLNYSAAYFETSIRFVRHMQKNDLEVSDLDSLRGFSIAVGNGFLYEPGFDRAAFLNKVTVETTEQALRMVAVGRADLTLDSEQVLNYTAKTLTPEQQDALVILPGSLTTQTLHMAVRRSLPEHAKIVADFDRALAEMRADGSLDRLLQRHQDN